MDFVLLTAAVTPAPQFGAAVSNPSERLAQYQQALSFWANDSTRCDWKIIVVETTGCPSSQLTARVPSSLLPRIIVVPFETKAELISKGKGSVEAAAIDSALNATDLPITDESTFYKATGRLVVGNAARLLSRLPRNTAMVRRSLDGKYCDSRFFGTTVKFWKDNLSSMGDEVNDDEGRFIEHVLAHRLRDSEYRYGAAIDRFPHRPRIAGQSGTSGQKYGRLGELARGTIITPFESVLASHFTSKQI